MKTLYLDNLTQSENLEYNNIALEIRSEYNNLIERISYKHEKNIHWIVSSLASRNKYQSSLFHRCCYIVLVKRLIEREELINKILLSDRPLATLLKKEVDKSIEIICTETIFQMVWRFMRPIRQILISYFFLILRLLGRSKINNKKINKHEPIVLVDTFVLNNNAGDEGSISNGIYKDRYYPGLLENLSEKEKKNIYFVPTIVGFKNPIAIFKKIRSAKYPFLLHDDFLKLSDYIFAMSHPFKTQMFKIDDSKFRGIDLISLIKQENRRNCSDFISLLGLLYYRFALRLKEENITVKTLIEWYENQVMDRGMIVGFHKFLPDTTIIGYQGYIISKGLHMYTQPNNSEFNGMAVPDLIGVTGKALEENIKEFCLRANVVTTPGFRFQKLWRERNLYPESGLFTILIGLPIGLDDCKEMLELLINNINLYKSRDLKFLIKPHPTWSPDIIKQLLPKGKLDSFQFILGDFHDALELANLVVSNASSVALEALAKGTPVIIIAPSCGILQNPIPEVISSDYWKICYSSDELLEQILTFKSIMNDNEIKFLKMGNEIRKNYFEPVSRNSVLDFLTLDKHST